MIVCLSSVNLAEIQVPVLAGSVGAALTLIAQECGFRFQWCSSPLAHHTHKDPVPRLGGIAVFGAIVLACTIGEFALNYRSWSSALPILLGALPVLVVGAYDDLRHASPKAKIVAQLFGTALLVAAHWKVSGDVSIYDLLLLPCWLVITTNSFNLIDGVDGLAGSTAVIIAIGLFLVNVVSGNIGLAALSMITAAACLGFLPFNLIGPRIFLGDSGSLTLGFILAATAYETPRASAIPWMAIVLFGYPLTETALSILRRTVKERSLCRPDREHMHHKLRHSGFSAAQTASLLCLVAFGFACLGVILGLGGSRWIGVGSAVILFLAVAKSFGYFRRRTRALLRRRIVALREPRQGSLPDIAGYLPFK